MLEIKEIEKILNNYNLGKIKFYEIQTSGYANVNYKITTPKGYYLLRVFKNKIVDEIKYEMKVLEELKNIDFPAAYPMRGIDGNYITISDFGPVVIYDFIEGIEPQINKESISQTAKYTAILNSYENWNSLEKENALQIDYCIDLINKFETAENKYPQIFKFFEKETIFLFDSLKIKLPKGIVHGDIFPDNTKFIDDKLLAFLDFEEVCTDNLLYDVGVAINGFCFLRNQLNIEFLKIFIEEYNKIRRMKKKEFELLPYYIEWGAHAMIYWHLSNLICKKDIRKLKRLEFFIERIRILKSSNILEKMEFYE